MKPAKIYSCQTCRETGYVQSAFGPLESCPNCAWGDAALAQSQPWNEPASEQVKSEAPLDKGTPAQVGRALKIVLYVGMAAAVWAVNYYLGGKTTIEDILEGQDMPRPAKTNDFSPWEPAP